MWVFFFFIFPRYFSADWILLHYPIIHMLDATIHHPPAGGCSRRNGWGRGGGGGRGCGGTSTSSQGGSAGRKKEPPRHGGVTSASAQRNTARRLNATIRLRCQSKFSCRVSGKVSRSTRRSESLRGGSCVSGLGGRTPAAEAGGEEEVTSDAFTERPLSAC